MNKELIAEDFNKWVELPVPGKFQNYEIFGDRILVRLYYFDASKYGKPTKVYKDLQSNTNLLDEKDSKLFAVGKVMALGSPLRDPWASLKPGDLVIVQDRVTGSSLNKDWENYHALTLEKPGMKGRVPEPPMIIGNAMQWKDDVFLEDKFEEQMKVEDAMTFLLQERWVLGKYKL